MNTNLIHQYCKVVKEIYVPMHAIYFVEDGFGYADIETRHRGVIHYSCDSTSEFNELVELSKDD